MRRTSGYIEISHLTRDLQLGWQLEEEHHLYPRKAAKCFALEEQQLLGVHVQWYITYLFFSEYAYCLN